MKYSTSTHAFCENVCGPLQKLHNLLTVSNSSTVSQHITDLSTAVQNISMRRWNLYSTEQTYIRKLVRINAPTEQQDLVCPCIYIYIYISCQGAHYRTCMCAVCIFLLCSGDKGAVDATHQVILLCVLTGWPPWPRMKAFTMVAEPLAAFARTLFFLRSAFAATTAGGRVAGGTVCACVASAGAAAIELLRLGGGISPITVLMSSAYSPSPSVPSQRSAHIWLSKPKNCFVIVSSFVLAPSTVETAHL